MLSECEFEKWTQENRRTDLPDFIEPTSIEAVTELMQHTPGIILELVTSLGAISSDDQWRLWPDEAVGGSNWHILPVKTFGRELENARKRFPYLMQVLTDIGGIESAAFSRLKPKTTLRPHAGIPLLAEKCLRVHLPLIIPGRATLTVGASTKELRVGQPLVFDEMQTHYAANEADAHRITLLLDLTRPASHPFTPHPSTHWSLDERNEVVDEAQMITDFERKLA